MALARLFLMVVFCSSGNPFLLETQAQSKPEEKPKYGGRLVYGSLRDIRTTNPFIDTYSTDYYVRSLIFEGITGLDQEGNAVPCLARSWEISKDGTVYTFHLRNGVKFHHGKPLTSEDVKWSIDYLRNPKNRAYYMAQFSDVTSVEAVDPSTVVIHLRKSFSPLITVVATSRAPILPAGSQWPPTSFSPGTGPFRFIEWQSGHHVTLKDFKDYWIQGIPYLEEITFRPMIEDSLRITALKAKEIHIAEELPFSVTIEAGRGTLGFDLVHNPGGDRRRIVFNTRIAPFNNVRIRQAVAYAIDKKELIEGRTWGLAEISNQRKRFYAQALAIIQREVPEIYLNMGPVLLGVASSVKGFSTGPMEERVAFMGGGLPYTWIDE